MGARIYTDKDGDLRWLKGKTCAVIGFGAQGRAQALNLRDQRIEVLVGLYPGSKSRPSARRNRLPVFDTAEAARRAEVIFLGLPDTKMPEVFANEIAGSLRRGQTLVLAHGFAILYRTVVPPKNLDVVLVAPKGLGPMVRREFLRGRGVPGLIAVHQNFSGKAERTALAWAKAIGCTRAGVMKTTFREETETDLFGEQAVLCGGVTELIRAAFETLVRAGYPRELAYFECLHELKFIVDLMYEKGIAGMTESISDTATWGQLTVGPQIVNGHVRTKMRETLRNIRTGKFARELIGEMKGDRARYTKLLRGAQAHPIEETGKKLRALMRWRKKEK